MAKDPPSHHRVTAFADHSAKSGRSITSNVTPEHFELVERIASMRGISVARYAREAVLEAVGRDLKQPIDMSCYQDLRELAGRYGARNRAELMRLAIRALETLESGDLESDQAARVIAAIRGTADGKGQRVERDERKGRRTPDPRRENGDRGSRSGEYETPMGGMAAARKVSSAPPRRK